MELEMNLFDTIFITLQVQKNVIDIFAKYALFLNVEARIWPAKKE